MGALLSTCYLVVEWASARLSIYLCMQSEDFGSL